tara:strand:- start:5180 stop:5716 length:537 start_codon:yes stop_codon:yes gene_type:complete
VAGFYRPPIRATAGGVVIGDDPEGDSGVVVGASVAQLQVDGQTKIDTRLDSVKIVSGGTFSVDSPVGVSFIIDSSGRTTFSLPVKTVDAAASPAIISSSDAFVLVDSSQGPVTIRLPNAGSIGDGRVFAIKDKGTGASNTVTIEASGGSKVDAANTLLADDDFSAAVLVTGSGDYWIV